MTMDDLANSWNRLTLSDREGPGCNLTHDDSVMDFSIAAKFLTRIALNVEVIAKAFTPLWRVRNGLKIQKFDDHKILFTFDNKEDVDRILNSKPWSFDRHLVIMELYEGDRPLNEIRFQKTTFGVQVHGLPIKYMSMEAGIKICEVVGEVVQPTETRLFNASNFIRLQVSIDTSLPLCHGRPIFVIGVGG